MSNDIKATNWKYKIEPSRRGMHIRTWKFSWNCNVIRWVRPVSQVSQTGDRYLWENMNSTVQGLSWESEEILFSILSDSITYIYFFTGLIFRKMLVRTLIYNNQDILSTEWITFELLKNSVHNFFSIEPRNNFLKYRILN